MNPGTSGEVSFLGFVIGALAFANFAVYMFREGIVLTTGMTDILHYSRATTLAYLTIAFCQFVNVMSRRHDLKSLFNRNFFDNRILLWSILGSIVMVCIGIYAPYISDFLHFSGPRPVDWLYVLGAAAIYLSIYEAVKLRKRRRGDVVSVSTVT